MKSILTGRALLIAVLTEVLLDQSQQAAPEVSLGHRPQAEAPRAPATTPARRRPSARSAQSYAEPR